MTWLSDNLLDCYETFFDFRNFHFEELGQELRRSSGESNIRSSVVSHLDLFDQSADGVLLLEMLSRNLLQLRQVELVALLVEDEHLLRIGLVYLAGEHLPDLLLVHIEEVGLLDVHDPSLEVLANVEDASAAEVGQTDGPGICVSYLVVIVPGLVLHLVKGDLAGRIFNCVDHFEVLIDFAVSFVRVYDDIEIIARTVGFGELGFEYIHEDSHHGSPVDVLLVLEGGEGPLQVDFFLCRFCCHFLIAVFFLINQNQCTA